MHTTLGKKANSATKGDNEAITIVGRAANPLNKENWEDDFELPESLNISEGPYLKALGKNEEVWAPEEKEGSFGVPEFGEEDPLAAMSDDEEKGDAIGVESRDFDDSDSEDWDQQAKAEREKEEKTKRHSKEATEYDFSGFGDDDEEEDWTTFDGFHGEEPSSSFAHLDIPDEEAVDENDIKQYSLIMKLMAEQGQERYNIVTYPEPPRLYSDNLKDKVGAYQDAELIAFLEGLGRDREEQKRDLKEETPKRNASISQRISTSTDKNKLKDSKQNKYLKKSRNYLSRDSSLKERVMKLSFEIDENDSLPAILTKCSEVVALLMIEKPERIAEVVGDCGKYLESNLSSPTITVFKDHTISANLFYNLLHITATYHQIHPIHIRTAIVCFPTFAPLFNLLKFECKAHHDGSVADLLLQSFCQIYANQKEITDEYEKKVSQESVDDSKVVLHVKGRDNNPEAQSFESVMQGESEPVLEKSRSGTKRMKVRVAYQVQARALSSLHLYLDNRSPIDWKKLSRAAQYDPLDNPSFEWLINAFDGIPPKESTDDQFKLTYEICGSEIKRMKILQGLYKNIDPFESLAKAQAAFALAKYLSEGSLQESTGGFLGMETLSHTRGNFSRVAENIAFECVIVLDRLGMQDKASLRFIQSPMGVSALVLFGDILNANSKYQYAVHAFESAINVYKNMEETRYSNMINTLSTLCEKHDDWERALKYHNKILEKAKIDGDLNMYVYIVQQISKIHTKAGDFLTAVKHLRSAIEILNQCIKEKQSGPVKHHHLRGVNNALDVHNRHLAKLHGLNTSKKIDFFPEVHMQEVRNQKVNLYLRLAQHFLDAKRIIEAIVVLEFLLDKEGNLPRGKISVVHLLLATAYTKKRLYGCARELIEHMQSIAREKKNSSLFNIPGSEDVCFNAEFTPILGVSPSEVVKTREFAALCAKNNYCLGIFPNAQLWTRVRISKSNPTSLTLGQRGNLHYRMGKILQGIIFQELATANMGANSISEEITVFPDTRECMKEFDQAYTFFEKVEDQVHIAKTLVRIVETYLHVAFISVALLGQKIEILEKWLETAGFTPDGLDSKDPKKAVKTWEHFLFKLEGPAYESLDVGLKTYHPVLYLKGLMNVAEIRYLQGNYEAALKFWRECKNSLFTVAMNSERCVMVDRATPGMTSSVHSIFERLVRMLMCFPPALINMNLVLIDSHHLHMIELFADVEQCSPMRLWHGEKKSEEQEQQNQAAGGSNQTGLRKQRMLHMRGIRDDVDIFMNNDTEVMVETRRWLRQRKTPEPLTQEKHWRKHLSAFMGAVGSRSMSKSLHHDLAGSMMYDNYLDRDSYKKAIELRDKVCSLFYQISLNFSQATAGRFTQKELMVKNRSDLNAIVKNMDQLRSLTYNKSGRPGGVASAYSPPVQGRKIGGSAAGKNPPVPPPPPPAAGSAAAHSSSRVAPASNFPTTRRASSVWMSEFSRNSNSRAGDPLWSTLNYCIPLGNVIVFYSPQLRAKSIRMVTAGTLMQGQSNGLRIEPKFLSRVFQDFIEYQNELRGGTVLERGEAKSRRGGLHQRETEILKFARKLGMLSEGKVDMSRDFGSKKKETSRDFQPLQEEDPNEMIDEEMKEDIQSKHLSAAPQAILDSSSGDLKVGATTTKANISNSEMRAIRRRLPSSQFLADLDDQETMPEEELHPEIDEIHPTPSKKTAKQKQKEKRSRNDRVGSLYDVLDELQGVSSSNAIKGPPEEEQQPKMAVGAPDSEEETPSKKLKEKKVDSIETESSSEYRKRTSSEITLAKLELDISFEQKEANSHGERRTSVLEIFSNRDKLVTAKSTSARRWNGVTFMVNCTDEKQTLWFVVRRGSRDCDFFGSVHIPLHDLVKAKSDFKLDLEDKSNLHSQPDLLNTVPKVGEITFHRIECGPKGKFRDENIEESLTFPDMKEDSDTDSQQAIIEKLLPPSFDIMLIKELLAALDRQNILALLSGMFNECQIILTSQNNFRLKAAINCLLRLMYPFHWQHTLVPLLPRSCVGMLSLKSPYIIAVNQFVFPSCIDLIPPKAIVAFLDHNQIRIRPGTFTAFPPQIKNRLSTAIQQFRVMLFRSLVTNKDPYAEGADKKLMRSGSFTTKATGSQRSGGDIQVKITGPTEEPASVKSTRLATAVGSTNSSRRFGSPVARPEMSLQILKQHFLDCFVSLFYKFRLNWTGNPKQPLDVRGFLRLTKPEYRMFVRRFVRTKVFGNFIELRANLSIEQHSPSYVFDEMVYRKIYDKYLKIRSLQSATKTGKMLCQKGKGRWKMRSVEILQNHLNVYKYNKRKGAKYTRLLKSGWFQIDIHKAVGNNNNYFSFELRNVWETQKDDSTLTFRVTSEKERQEWVKAINVRIMDSHLKLSYEFVVNKLGPRFAGSNDEMVAIMPKQKQTIPRPG
eukprot:jgi/Bigna1/141196/aug1.61_g15904